MSCCRGAKWAVIAAGVIAAVIAVKTSWGELFRGKIKGWAKKQVPVELQIDRMKQEIAKLDRDIEKNWGPIAAEEVALRDLKKDIDGVADSLDKMKTAMLAAASDLEAKATKIRYRNSDRTPTEVRRLLSTDANTYEIKLKEVDSKRKLLAAREKKLDAFKTKQVEMKAQKEKLTAELAEIDAQLQVLRLAETKSHLPAGTNDRLDDIKRTMDELRKHVDVRTRELELREGFNATDDGDKTTPTKDKGANDEVIRKVRAVTGDEPKVAAGSND
jgi:chromosome segregation ATPase